MVQYVYGTMLAPLWQGASVGGVGGCFTAWLVAVDHGLNMVIMLISITQI